MYGFLPVEAMASTLPFSMIVVAVIGIPGQYRPNVALLTLVFANLELVIPLYTHSQRLRTTLGRCQWL